MSGADFTPKKLPRFNLLRGFKQAVGHIIDQHWMEAGQVADLIERSIMEWANRIAGQLNTDLQAVSDALWNVPWGPVPNGTAIRTTNSAAVTNTTDLANLSVTWTAIAGRKYTIDAQGYVQVSAVGTEGRILIRDGNNTQLASGGQTPAATGRLAMVKFSLEDYTPNAGSVTSKLALAGLGGVGGTATLIASTTSPAHIKVRDDGPVTPR